MSGNLNNELQDLIYLVLDGEATSTEQQVLFDALKDNPELQSEFNSALGLNKALSVDKLNLMPPPALTDNLFRRAGFTNPASIPAGYSGSLLSNLSRLVQKYASSAGAALVAASLTFTLYTNVDKVITTSYNKKINETSTKEIVSKNYPLSSTINEKPVISSVNSIENSGKAGTNSINIDAASKSVKQNNSKNAFAYLSDDESSENVSNSNDDNTSYSSESSSNLAENIEYFGERPNELNSSIYKEVNQRAEVNLSSYPYSNNFMKISFEEYEKLNLSIELRGINALNYFPSRTIDETSAGLNNLSLSVFYHFDDNHSMGLSAGKENLQMYEIIPGKKRYTFDKESDIVFAGISYKYNLGEVNSLFGVNPYTDILIGGTKYGPLSKAGIGLSYNVYSNLNFSLGFEWTSLMYSELNTYKVTHKSGLVYKLSYNF